MGVCMAAEINTILTIVHIAGFILAIALIFTSILLLKRLKDEDFAVSMIFLHEKEINKIFLVLVVGSFIFFTGHLYYSLGSLFNDINIKYVLDLIGILYTISLLYFVYGLQNVLKREKNEHL
jgi:hypothetical protein